MKHLLIAFSLLACGSSGSSPEPVPDEPTSGAERPSWTVEQCSAAGGTLVGDIGDGAIHRPEYRCENGEPPLASVPLGIEGSVCCAGGGPVTTTS